MDSLVYLDAMKRNIVMHDRAPPATYSPLCDRSRSDYARCILACCQAAGIAWC